MCIGIPMQVIEAWPGGARAQGRGRTEQLDTRLVGGQVQAGEWLLEFQGAARERLDPARAEEINATLDLLEAAMAGDAERAATGHAFDLPSSMSPDQLAALTGAPGAAAARPNGDPA